MKKTLLFITVLALTGALAFASSARDSGQTQGGASSGQIELRVLNYLNLTEANSADSIKVVWDGFTAANPDIKIIREDLFNDPFHEKVAAYAAAGQLPDVLYAWPGGKSSPLHNEHLLKDLSPLIKRDGLDKVFSATALDVSGQVAGYQAMIPMTVTSSHAFYVNTEVLNALGLKPATTYAELKAQVPVLKAAGKETVIMDNKSTWVMQSCLFSLVAGRFGGDGWSDKILSGQTRFTDPDFVNALAFIKTIYDDGVILTSSLNADYGEGRGRFANGAGAYLIDGDWATSAFITDKSTGEALIPPARQPNFKITVFPDIPGAKLNKSTSVTLGVGWGMSAAIPAGSAKEEAAWRLIKWLTSAQVQEYQLNTGGINSAVNNQVDMSKVSLEPLQKEIGNLPSQYTKGTVVIDAVFDASVFSPLNDGLQELGIGSKTPQQVAEIVQRAFDAWKAKQ